MESALLIVTLVSLVLAIGMSILGWSLLTSDRRRSAARVTALEADALAMASEDHRFTALDAADENEPRGGDVGGGHHSRERFATFDAPAHEEMFSASQATEAAGRRWISIAAVAVLAIAGASSLLAFHRQGSSSTLAAEASMSPTSTSATASTSASASAPASGSASAPATPASGVARVKPLELVSVRHVEGAGGLDVTGLVQNPPDGQALKGVVAVIYVFDRDGNFLTSGHSPLEIGALHPGEDSPFVVHVPAAPAESVIGRYRVTFRSDELGVLPHLDKRAVAVGSGG